MKQAANNNTADVSEPVPALGTQDGSRFVDWAARLSVLKVRDQAHLGYCSPTQARPGADRSLSGSNHFPEASQDDQRYSQPSPANRP